MPTSSLATDSSSRTEKPCWMSPGAAECEGLVLCIPTQGPRGHSGKFQSLALRTYRSSVCFQGPYFPLLLLRRLVVLDAFLSGIQGRNHSVLDLAKAPGSVRSINLILTVPVPPSCLV